MSGTTLLFVLMGRAAAPGSEKRFASRLFVCRINEIFEQALILIGQVQTDHLDAFSDHPLDQLNRKVTLSDT
ncbi:hypothetical protein ATE62_22130 [Sphingopyxis sp. HIX]|nr:hypothetical protein ATE62_22130 [Sphingopyxis sp. HIX]